MLPEPADTEPRTGPGSTSRWLLTAWPVTAWPGQPAVGRLRLHAAGTALVAAGTALVATLTAMVATLTAMVATLTAMVATLTAMVATLTAAAEATMAAALPVDRQQDALNVHAAADQDPDLPAPLPRRDVPRRAPAGARRGRRVSGR